MSTPGEGQREKAIQALGRISRHAIPRYETTGSRQQLRDDIDTILIALHNAGASVTEPAIHNSAKGGEAHVSGEPRSGSDVAAGASASAGAPVKGPSEPEAWATWQREVDGRIDASTVVEGPSEPGGRSQASIELEARGWKRINGPFAAPATQEAPLRYWRCEGFCKGSFGRRTPPSDGCCIGCGFGPLREITKAEHEAPSAPSTSPSAPAEPLGALIQNVVNAACVFGAKANAPADELIEAGRVLDLTRAALRAALSVSTSAPKETSEPREDG